ncbi:hypothetical protein [Bacteroides intestinalis]|uniref:hypothetical protein n=1 Tax=Bacteroides intestinalis TaxID=329854 RepID=UPI001F01064C|nr:hypothetical protein [Bacteroides intestinalis]
MKQTKSGKSEIILNTLSPYDSKVQRYLSLSKEIEQLMNNAKDENEGCVSISWWQNSVYCKKNFIRKH